MRLVEGELVSVFERQCRGWVSAARANEGVVLRQKLINVDAVRSKPAGSSTTWSRRRSASFRKTISRSLNLTRASWTGPRTTQKSRQRRLTLRSPKMSKSLSDRPSLIYPRWYDQLHG